MTGEMMDGEQRHAESRKRFWRTLGIAGVGGVPVGFAVGFGAGYTDGDLDAFWNWAPDWLILALLAFSLVTIVYGSWRFYTSVDEVELLDNLWSSAAAYGTYALLFPTWWVLGKTGMAPPPSDWIIFLVALVGGLAFYLWRKWRAR